MFAHIDFYHNGNPYIVTTDRGFFRILCRYELEQIDEVLFSAKCEREKHEALTYYEKKAILRDFAIYWQYRFSELFYSWGEVASWGSFFEIYGKRYGLLEEFHENGIC